MPLPKKLKATASKAKKKATMAAAMHDLKGGKHHAERTHAQEVAIGLKQSGQSKGKAPEPRSRKRKRPRNKGRS